ncbi:restriction endonuclease subunit S [Escherichia coli]|uniref:restriction endonuclease subunit S n=1 Tax=Escherichia coli TaxID=562 RepID=UPI000927727E|nr:restriction endonuclease subunit S [Escherichia coli]MBN6246458.1 restriction endonuclease subunit S [Escherichia coli]MCA7537892.1 restriction endonuclease subunit S [Escherichia coli]MDA4394480.1 restriction endonuclease subunit S [Escherichia coli]MDE1137861.1 restriction endonuclease subunit S [Escherichia coli]OJQ87533.1 restriction endonuclease subunit S [Escherichia coli]
MSEMSYLEKLLDGVEVEWKTLGQTCKIETGKLNANAAVDDGEYMFFTTAKETSKIDKFRWDTEALLIAGNANVGEVKHYIGKFEAYQRTYVLTNFDENVSVRFLYFVLSHSLKKYLEERTNSAAMTYIVLSTLENFPIPIPCPDNPEKSLAIQSEIVRILDKFTALTAELTAELNMRKKQYNYYRDQLLSFDESSVEWKTLLEACDYVDYRGKTPKKTQSGIFLVTAKNIRMGYIDYHASQEFISEEDYAIVMRRGLPKKGDVLITTEAPCGFVAQVNRENIALAQRVIKYRSKNTQLSNSFLKHYLLGSQFQDKLMQAATGSTVKGIKGSRLHQLKIPIPSKVEQDRIVAILDKFDTLTNSITEGLPREIELRQKQYEYYRDLLFSFPTPETVSN